MNSTKTYLRLLGMAILLVVMALPAQADTIPPRDFHVAPAPAGLYQPREFNQGRLDEARKNTKYQYHRDKPEPPKRKPKPREQRRPMEARPDYYDGPRADFSGIAKAFIWVVVIGLVVFVVFQLLRINMKGLAKKKSDKAKVVKETEIPIEEDITKMEFEDLLQAAVDAGRFRVAVRLLYLRTLRQLSEKGLITWKQEKTNHDYVRELGQKRIRAGFSDVTLIFEYIWYGEVPVNKDDFNLARASFVQFEQSLRQESHAV
jgi:hypothetical protein